jgi:hypothetical protein
MPRLTLAPVLLILAATLTGADTVVPSFPSGAALSIDGTAAGVVRVWSGGDRFLRVTWPVSGNPAASAQPELAPLEFELTPAQVGPWLPMLQEFAAASGPGHRLVVAEQFSTGAGPAVAYTDAKIQELTVPPSSDGVVRVKVSAGGRAATTETVPTPAGTGIRSLSPSTVAVSGMAALRAAEVQPITLRAGSGGIQLVEPLTLRIALAEGAPFQTWLDQALAGTASTTTVTVSLPKSATEAWLTLTFANALPLRVVRDAAIRKYRVELASTQVNISGAPPAPPAATSSTPPDSGTAPVPTPAPGAATPPPADTGVPAPVPTPASAGAPAVPFPTTITQLPATSPAGVALGGIVAPAPVDPAVAAIKQPSTGTTVPVRTKSPATSDNRADQGLRDPAEFPRLSSLTRVRYSNSESAHRTVESADYEGKTAVGDLWKTYRKTAEAAGWVFEGMNESGTSPETVMIISYWRSGPASADLRLYATKEGGATVSLTVTTDK